MALAILRRGRGQTIAVVTLVLLLTGFVSFEAICAPKAELWPKWQAHDAGASEIIDHSAWSRFLQTYLSTDAIDVNRVAYGHVTVADKEALNGYLEYLSNLPIKRFNRAEQAAYWINLYNALTIKLMLEFYPVDSIRDIDISPGLFSDGPWGRTLLEVNDEPVSLDDIEHRILRPIWKDPRIHYAVNCASVGCPNLAKQAYTGATLELMLEAGARAYINSPRGAHFDRKGGLVVSSIYSWFQEDFGAGETTVIKHLRRYAEPTLDAKLAAASRITSYKYDWRVNGVGS